jgi:hypothetical protein
MRLAIDVQPAMALHQQMEAGACQALRRGMPATAVSADVEHAGVQFKAL